MPSGYCKKEAAARYIGVSKDKLLDFTRKGLTCYRVSRNLVLFKYTDIDQFLLQYRITEENPEQAEIEFLKAEADQLLAELEK